MSIWFTSTHSTFIKRETTKHVRLAFSISANQVNTQSPVLGHDHGACAFSMIEDTLSNPRCLVTVTSKRRQLHLSFIKCVRRTLPFVLFAVPHLHRFPCMEQPRAPCLTLRSTRSHLSVILLIVSFLLFSAFTYRIGDSRGTKVVAITRTYH